ncbi:hypothetical protein HZS_3180 [Henneguya salminicola]|nr:hypothetical protein HZS_3180 [Henneguya salminicola]
MEIYTLRKRLKKNRILIDFKSVAFNLCKYLSQFKDYFDHNIELTIHKVVEKDKDFPSQNKSIFPALIQLIQNFDSWLKIICYSMRKMETSLWPFFTKHLDSLPALFNRCVENDNIELATSYLVLIQHTNSPAESRDVFNIFLKLQLAIQILHKVLLNKSWDLVENLVRYIKSLKLYFQQQNQQIDPVDRFTTLLSKHAETLLTDTKFKHLGYFIHFTNFDLKKFLTSNHGKQIAQKVCESDLFPLLIEDFKFLAIKHHYMKKYINCDIIDNKNIEAILEKKQLVFIRNYFDHANFFNIWINISMLLCDFDSIESILLNSHPPNKEKYIFISNILCMFKYLKVYDINSSP